MEWGYIKRCKDFDESRWSCRHCERNSFAFTWYQFNSISKLYKLLKLCYMRCPYIPSRIMWYLLFVLNGPVNLKNELSSLRQLFSIIISSMSRMLKLLRLLWCHDLQRPYGPQRSHTYPFIWGFDSIWRIILAGNKSHFYWYSLHLNKCILWVMQKRNEWENFNRAS